MIQSQTAAAKPSGVNSDVGNKWKMDYIDDKMIEVKNNWKDFEKEGVAIHGVRNLKNSLEKGVKNAVEYNKYLEELEKNKKNKEIK